MSHFIETFTLKNFFGQTLNDGMFTTLNAATEYRLKKYGNFSGVRICKKTSPVEIWKDTFQIEITTNAFAPRVRQGENVIFKVGRIAEAGDLVVCDDNGIDIVMLWQDGIKYRAAQFGIILKNSGNKHPA